MTLQTFLLSIWKHFQLVKTWLVRLLKPVVMCQMQELRRQRVWFLSQLLATLLTLALSPIPLSSIASACACWSVSHELITRDTHSQLTSGSSQRRRQKPLPSNTSQVVTVGRQYRWTHSHRLTIMTSSLCLQQS